MIGWGDEILESFDDKQLKYFIQRVPYPTGTVQVQLDENGIPGYEIKEKVAWDNIPFTPGLETLARQSRAICFGSLAQRDEVSRAAINRFSRCDAWRKIPIRSSISISVRGFYSQEVLCRSFERCNILKLNDEELITISRMFGYPGDRSRKINAGYCLGNIT